MTDISHPLLTSLARLCRERRRQHKITQATIAEHAGLSRQAIVEFEGARSWPRDPERIVAAYSDEPLMLWRDAAIAASTRERMLEALAEGLRHKHPGAIVEVVDDRDDAGPQP